MTVIFLDRKDGTRLETLIDTADLPKLQEINCKWCAFIANDDIYVCAQVRLGKRKYDFKLLHRFLMNAEKGYEVDHRNHNTLDNRRSSNLRLTTHNQNQQNRMPDGNLGSKSKYRGVGWDEKNQKWRAYYCVNGKTKFLGRFESEEEAAKVAAEARKKYMTHNVEVM